MHLSRWINNGVMLGSFMLLLSLQAQPVSPSPASVRGVTSYKHPKHPRPSVVTHGQYRLKMAMILNSPLIKRLKCHTTNVNQCIFDVMYTLFYVWAKQLQPSGITAGHPPRKGSNRRSLEVGESWTFFVDPGEESSFRNHERSQFVESGALEGHVEDYMSGFKERQPHYVTMAYHGENQYSAGWHINETSSPGLNAMIARKKYNFITSGVWYYYKEDPNGKTNFHKDQDHLANMAAVIAIFLNKQVKKRHGLHLGYCLGARTTRLRHHVINHGSFRFGFNHNPPRHEANAYNVCSHRDQGVNR